MQRMTYFSAYLYKLSFLTPPMMLKNSFTARILQKLPFCWFSALLFSLQMMLFLFLLSLQTVFLMQKFSFSSLLFCCFFLSSFQCGFLLCLL